MQQLAPELAFNGDGTVRVLNPSEGSWRVAATALGYTTLEGWGGEETLTIIPMGMQDGTLDITLVHAIVDSPSKISQQCQREGYEHCKYDAVLNEQLKKLFS